MKIILWLIICGLVVAMFQYGLFRENGERRQINFPSAVVK